MLSKEELDFFTLYWKKISHDDPDSIHKYECKVLLNILAEHNENWTVLKYYKIFYPTSVESKNPYSAEIMCRFIYQQISGRLDNLNKIDKTVWRRWGFTTIELEQIEQNVEYFAVAKLRCIEKIVNKHTDLGWYFEKFKLFNLEAKFTHELHR
jgi:hypothetical protein